MQREEKQLDASIEALIQRVTDIKNSISGLILKLETEYETLNWPSVLDNFALISGQISSLQKLLKSDKTSLLRNYVLIPLVLSVDRDSNLEKLTEGRVLFFNHEVVPNYLRTKCEPAVEEKHHQFQNKATNIQVDNLNKQINTLNKLSANMCEMIRSYKESSENESNQKSQQPQTYSMSDTASLIAAVTMGKSLRVQRRPEVPQPGVSQGMTPSHGQVMPDQRQSYYQQGLPYRGAPGGQMNKVPSQIKTNIKSGSGYHPYNRQ